MILYISQTGAQKFGYGINAIFPIVAVLWCKNSENSGCSRCFFARRIPQDPGFVPNTTPCSLIIRGKNSENSKTVASNLHEAHPRRHSGAPSPGPRKTPPEAELRGDFGRQFPEASVPAEAGIQSLPRLKPGTTCWNAAAPDPALARGSSLKNMVLCRSPAEVVAEMQKPGDLIIRVVKCCCCSEVTCGPKMLYYGQATASGGSERYCALTIVRKA